MPTDAELDTAFTAAQAPLTALRDAATDAGDPGVAGVAEAAIAGLRRRHDQALGANLLARWTPQRAVDTLAEASPTITAAVGNQGAACVELEHGRGRIDVVAAATVNPVAGYAVHQRTAAGDVVATYHAQDGPALVTIVRTLQGASSLAGQTT